MTRRTGCLTQEAVQRLLASASEPSDAARTANVHLANCPDCRQMLRDTAGATDKFVRLLTPHEEDATCLEADLILRYVHGLTDPVENEIVDLHQEDCQFCRSDILALQQLRRVMETDEQQESTPALAEAADVAVVRMPIPGMAGGAENPAGTDARSSQRAILSWWKRLRAQASPTPAPPQPVSVESIGRSPLRLQVFALLRNPLTLLASGAVAAGCLVYILQGVRLQRQLAAQRETYNKQTRVLQQRITALALTASKAGQDREKLSATLSHTLFPGATKLPIDDADGTWIRDPKGKTFRIQELPSQVSRVLVHRQLAFASEARINLQSIRPMKRTVLRDNRRDGIPFQLKYPVACFVATRTPTFRWQALAGATYYRVEITEQESGAEFEASPRIYSTQWTPQDHLSNNKVYSWQVIAYKVEDGEEVELARSYNSPMESAKFRVLDETTIQTLNRFADQPLVLGILYAQAGMPDKAADSLKQFANARPNSALAAQLLQQVQKLKRQKQTIQMAPDFLQPHKF